MAMGNCCKGSSESSYDVAAYNVGQPENVQTVHSFREEHVHPNPSLSEASSSEQLTNHQDASQESPETDQEDLQPNVEHNEEAVTLMNKSSPEVQLTNHENLPPQPKVEPNEEVATLRKKPAPKVPARRQSSRKSALAVPVVSSIPEFRAVAVADEPIRIERVAVELGQRAAPPPTKRTISVEAKSTGFIVDVPQMEGLGPDGSFMVAFNKFEPS